MSAGAGAVGLRTTLDAASWKRHTSALREAARAARDHESRDALIMLAEDCEAMAAEAERNTQVAQQL